MSREYGPLEGDTVILGDTKLRLRIDSRVDDQGDEFRVGFAKTGRDGMGLRSLGARESCDLLITNVVVLDPVDGVRVASIGIREGRICGIGKAGNPDVQAGVDITIGPGTEIIAGEGRIITAGAMDAHIHFICPQQVDDALHSGLTTMLGGGTGPAHGTLATTCTPGPWHLGRMLQAADAFPMNLAFAGKGNASLPAALPAGRPCEAAIQHRGGH